MEIVSIFGKNLFAIKYTGEQDDEFRRLFSQWHDLEYLEEFFESHQKDITDGFWGTITIEDAIFKTFEYAKTFENKFIELSEQIDDDQLLGFEEIFLPLHDSQKPIIRLNKSKAKTNWLRLYALRVDRNIYIITGGAIKLTQKMQERIHTNQELIKMESCRQFLLSQGIVDVDGIIEEMEI
jgi:hypothetical protein